MATREDIRTRARIRADQDNSTFPTDTQYNYLIDEAAKEVWFDLIKAGWPIRPSTATLTTAGSQFLSLGVSGVAFVQTVYRNDGGQYTELRPIQEGDRAGLLSTQTNLPNSYSVVLNSSGYALDLLPASTGVSIRVDYISEYTGFSGDSDTWYGPARSDEMIVLKAAMKGCRKEGNDQGAQFLAQEYEYLKECVQEMASWANMRNSQLIRDVGPVQLRSARLPGDYDIY